MKQNGTRGTVCMSNAPVSFPFLPMVLERQRLVAEGIHCMPRSRIRSCAITCNHVVLLLQSSKLENSFLREGTPDGLELELSWERF